MVSEPSTGSNAFAFFEKLKTMGFFYRLFSWKKFVALSYDAYQEFISISDKLADLSGRYRELEIEYNGKKDNYSKMEAELNTAKASIETQNRTLSEKNAENVRLTESNQNKGIRIVELSSDIEKLNEKVIELTKDKNDLNVENSTLKADSIKDFNRINDLNKDLSVTEKKTSELSETIKKNEGDLGKLRESESKNTKRIAELEAEVGSLKQEISRLIDENRRVEKSLTEWEQGEEQRRTSYNQNVAQLNSLKQQLDDDRRRVQEQREGDIRNRNEELKRTWQKHEVAVEQCLRNICQTCGIEYVDKEKFPFRNKPDNALRICDELVIFDAKSPSGEDLNNFPIYIKQQAEAAKKYAKEDGIHKQLFLVVPTNTIDVVDTFYNITDYSVHVVSIDSLRPLVLQLKRIEDYNIAEQLSPDDRDNICRVIGKLVHASKRRIILDSYMCAEISSILNSCTSLPSEIQLKVNEYEKSDKLNPPMERRSKQISATDLKAAAKLITHEADFLEAGIIEVEGERKEDKAAIKP